MDDVMMARIQSLEARVAQLEVQPQRQEVADPEDSNAFWALDGLMSRLDPESSGAVMLLGRVVTPRGVEAQWQVAEHSESFFDSDFASRAESLAALGNPTRLRILQRILIDAGTVQELVASEEFGTSGQIYHHLRQLVSTGWLQSQRGGKYEVPVARVVPLLAILLGASS